MKQQVSWAYTRYHHATARAAEGIRDAMLDPDANVNAGMLADRAFTKGGVLKLAQAVEEYCRFMREDGNWEALDADERDSFEELETAYLTFCSLETE